MSFKNSLNYLWSTWAKALGHKASSSNKHSDHVASIRTLIFCSYLITNIFIISGVIRHWNKSPNIIYIHQCNH